MNSDTSSSLARVIIRGLSSIVVVVALVAAFQGTVSTLNGQATRRRAPVARSLTLPPPDDAAPIASKAEQGVHEAPPPSPAEVASFGTGTSGFTALRDGACDAWSEPIEGLCVHALVRARMGDEELLAAIRAYRRGAAAPTVENAQAPPVTDEPTSTEAEGVPIFVAREGDACPTGYRPFEHECALGVAYRDRRDEATLREFVTFFRNTGISPRIVVGEAPTDADAAGPSVVSDQARHEHDDDRYDDRGAYVPRSERRVFADEFRTSWRRSICRSAREALGIPERGQIHVAPEVRRRDGYVRSSRELRYLQNAVRDDCRRF